MLMLQALEAMQKQTTEEQFGTSFLSKGAIQKLYPRASFIRELDTPHGRPDVVLFDTKPSNSWSIMKAILASPSSAAFALVFFALKDSDRALTIDELSMRTALSNAYLRTVLKALHDQRLVKAKSNGITLSSKARIPNTSIVSIEFKLHDWRKALQQAVRHLAFADKAFVIMPAAKRDLLMMHRDIFEDFGVSLAVFNTDTNDLEVICDVSPQNRSEASYIDLVTRIWANRSLIGQI